LNTSPANWVASAPTTYVDCTACLPVLGCTDPLATNYNPAATVDDGSCIYPCCDAPLFGQAAGHVDSCDAEYVMTIDCNNPSTDNAESIKTILQFWDGSTWQIVNTDIHNPVGTDNIVNHSVTYHYNCSTDDFGGYGTGQYRILSEASYSNGYSCINNSASATITLGIGGCIDPTATNYNAAATCQCVTCLYSYCCDTPVLTLDLTNGICNQELNVDITCSPGADDGYTLIWQRWNTTTLVWDALLTVTNSAFTTSINTNLLNTYLHTASGTSENYRVVFTSDYTAPTPDCTVYSNTLTVVAPILGCMDGGFTEYTVGPGGTGFGTAGDGITASNYNALAECDDLSCCIDGCTDILATNYNSLATCNSGCTYACCTIGPFVIDTVTYGICYEALNFTSDFSSCPAPPTSIIIDLFDPLGNLIDTNTYASPVDGTVYHWSNTFLDTASSNTSGAFIINVTYQFAGTSIPDCVVMDIQIVVFPILGCTNPLSVNYNPAATCDDGSCVAPVDACTDSAALNYNPNAVNDDGSCIYCGDGCTDSSGGYTNYDATAICDCDYTWLGMGTCSVAGWYDETSCNSHGSCSIGSWNTEEDCCTMNAGTWSGSACSGGAATFTTGVWTNTYSSNQLPGWNNCCVACTYGCTDITFLNYNSLATCDCNSSDPAQGYTGPLDVTLDNDCCTNCIYGCTDGGSQTQTWWDGTNGPSYDYATATGFVSYPLAAPNDFGANNYNSLATCEDASCTYSGCTDPLADNYNAIFTGDCVGTIAGTNVGCCIYPTTGCIDTATPAFNVTPLATVDDGSCMYCDSVTGNLEDSALVDQAAWAIGNSTSVPSTTTASNDGSLFTTFTLTATGLLLQALTEFQSSNNTWAIELYQVPTNGGASGTGTLTATSPAVSTTTGTVFSNTFLSLPYGYYAARLVTINSVGTVEPTHCFIEINGLVQAEVCTDPLAANTAVIPVDLQYTNNSYCIYPGYCACAGSLSVVAGAACSNTATIHATISCVTSTDIAWYWADGAGTVLSSGTTLGITAGLIVSSLPITLDGTYTFNWTETSTPFATCPLTTATIVTNSIISCGCTDPTMANYNVAALYDCNGDPLGTLNPGWNSTPCCLSCIYGCTTVTALNYNPLATCDDGSCINPGDGCCDSLAANFNSAATNCVPSICTYCN
jgi:hypothetical protein